eukprot:scaffold379_cov235-Pinguiococcus_pyrenoidosus.AAC.25
MPMCNAKLERKEGFAERTFEVELDASDEVVVPNLRVVHHRDLQVHIVILQRNDVLRRGPDRVRGAHAGDRLVRHVRLDSHRLAPGLRQQLDQAVRAAGHAVRAGAGQVFRFQDVERNAAAGRRPFARLGGWRVRHLPVHQLEDFRSQELEDDLGAASLLMVQPRKQRQLQQWVEGDLAEDHHAEDGAFHQVVKREERPVTQPEFGVLGHLRLQTLERLLRRVREGQKIDDQIRRGHEDQHKHDGRYTSQKEPLFGHAKRVFGLLKDRRLAPLRPPRHELAQCCAHALDVLLNFRHGVRALQDGRKRV